MNFKNIGFIVFAVGVALLILVAILGIWEVIDQQNAWKAAQTLFLISFGVLLLLGVSQKLFK